MGKPKLSIYCVPSCNFKTWLFGNITWVYVKQHSNLYSSICETCKWGIGSFIPPLLLEKARDVLEGIN